MYLMCLMMAYKASGGMNKDLEEELNKVRLNEGERVKYGIGAKLNKVNQLLGLTENTEENHDKKEAVDDTYIENKTDETREFCFICYEAAKVSNHLVYLANIYKDKSACGIIYGDQSKSNTLITTCLHTVHANCYIEMEKEGVQLRCPECKKRGHCILPTTLEDEDLNRICENVVNVSMLIVHNVYNHEENFMLLFKYLVESKGLSSMITSAESELRRLKREKTDKSVLGLLQSIYQHASEDQQKNYVQAIEEFREEVQGCQKEFAMMQDLFIQAIKIKLNLDCVEVDAALLKELQARIKKEELGIAKRELEGLLEKEVVFEEEEEMMESEELSFLFNVKRPPTSASDIASFGSEKC